jgi:hypothetical protein
MQNHFKSAACTPAAGAGMAVAFSALLMPAAQLLILHTLWHMPLLCAFQLPLLCCTAGAAHAVPAAVLQAATRAAIHGAAVAASAAAFTMQAGSLPAALTRFRVAIDAFATRHSERFA